VIRVEVGASRAPALTIIQKKLIIMKIENLTYDFWGTCDFCNKDNPTIDIKKQLVNISICSNCLIKMNDIIIEKTEEYD